MRLSLDRNFSAAEINTLLWKNYPDLVVTFLKNPVEKKTIFESMRGRHERISFLAFQTKIHKE